MRASDVKEEAWGASPHPILYRATPDFEAMYYMLEASGWLVLEPHSLDHRLTANGAMESKTVKDFKNWMLNNKHLMLNTKRLGQYRWYLTIGAPYKRNPRKGEKA